MASSALSGLLMLALLGGLCLAAVGCGIWGIVVWLEKRADRKSGQDQSR